MSRFKKAYYVLAAFTLSLLPQISEAAVQLKDPLNLGSNPLPILANRFIQTALGISGILALIAFVYGGLLYMLAGVNPKNVEKGKELMKYAIIGLFIISSSYAIINFFLRNVLQVPA